jgi:hypothetical protein
VVGFIDPVADLDGAYQEVACDDKGEITLYRGLKGPANYGGAVDTGDCGGNVQFRVGFIEELDGDSRKGSGSRILQCMKEREIEHDVSLAENPGLSRHRWLTGGRKSCDGLPQTLWRREFISPCHLAEEAAQNHSKKNMSDWVNHRIVPLCQAS